MILHPKDNICHAHHLTEMNKYIRKDAYDKNSPVTSKDHKLLTHLALTWNRSNFLLSSRAAAHTQITMLLQKTLSRVDSTLAPSKVLPGNYYLRENIILLP